VSAPALELIDVRAGYGRIDVLHGVNLTIPKGKVLALLGANGAGKSTTAQIAGGRLVPRSGCLHIAGNHVNGAHPAAMAKAGSIVIHPRNRATPPPPSAAPPPKEPTPWQRVLRLFGGGT